MSKIQFESESQHAVNVPTIASDCKQLCQRYNLKANHNVFSLQLIELKTVSNYVKDTI